jgi:glutamate-1-semialdehyde 2,1-aminomutase
MIYNEGYSEKPDTSYIQRAEGCRVWGPGGRGYIDLAMGGGSLILGHAHPVVVEAVREQVAKGSIYTVPHAAVYELDELLDTCIPWLPGRVWCNSGSEAVMRLVRIARAVTGKHKIGLFSGCWHGSWDGTLVEEEYSAVGLRSIITGGYDPEARLRSAGVPQEILDSILFLPYRDSAALSTIRGYRDELACVLIEPVQGSNPSDEVEGFLANLRHITQDCGVLLAFDEVVTGFRLGLGGGQEHFGVHGDLAAYGKVIGGGLPVGMVAGTREIMDEARRKGVFYGGTFSANPLTIAAGLATLRYLAQHPETYRQLADAGTLLRSTVNRYCTERALPAHMMGVGSISRLVLSGEPVHSRRERDLAEPGAVAQARFYSSVKACSVWIGTNRIQFLSTAHGILDIELVANALCESLNLKGEY